MTRYGQTSSLLATTSHQNICVRINSLFFKLCNFSPSSPGHEYQPNETLIIEKNQTNEWPIHKDEVLEIVQFSPSSMAWISSNVEGDGEANFPFFPT
jgi:hypothetical protein